VAKLVVKPEAARATFSIDGTDEPTDRVELTAGEDHTVVVSAPGFVDQITNVSGRPEEIKDVVIELEAAKAKGATGNGTAPTQAGTAESTSGGTGKLSIAASGGWCDVTIDGSARGATPVAGVELSAGQHRVTCTTQDGASHTATVNVVTDAVTRYKFAL
jgi:serine/threonine-protein kinase